jgi:3-phenylpropionate/cinnamic acid dioxygenase small subunit
MVDDLQAIRNLSYEYAFRLDDGDWAGVAELLADSGLRPVAAGMTADALRGRETIERFYAEQVVTYNGKPRTRHLITNHLIELDSGGETASARCYFTVLQAVPRERLDIVVGGQYHDRFAKVDGAWRFIEKAIQVDYLNDIAKHFLITDEHSWAH